jgi:hypothetical protein
MTVRKKSKPYVLDPYKFFDLVRQTDSDNQAGYVFSVYEKLFNKRPPEGVHWILVKEAVGYELMARTGRLTTARLKRAHECSLKLDVNEIPEPRHRDIVKSLMGVEDVVVVEEEAINHKEEKMAAKKKAAKKVAKKKTVAKAPAKKAKGKGRPVGKISGVGIEQTWVYIFVRNAKVRKAERLDDAGITAFMKKEFPNRDTKVFDHVQSARNKYNKGGFNKGTPPNVQSVRYGEDGEQVTSRGGAVKEAKAPVKKAAKKAPAKKKAAKKKAAKKK